MRPDQAERRANILRLRERGLTCAAIAEMYGISRQRVDQIARKARLDAKNAGYLASLRNDYQPKPKA